MGFRRAGPLLTGLSSRGGSTWRVDFTSFEGYLSARVLVEGLRRAGHTPSRESLIAGLETLRDFDFGGFSVTYSAKDHQGSSFTDLTIIERDGKFKH